MKFYSKKSSESGFTLIELLVVVAIISLLSSVILASFTDARRKARNVQRLEDAQAYSKAVESYQVNARAYPDGGVDWTTVSGVCLGRPSSGAGSTCFAGSYTGNTTMNTQFTTEMSNIPKGQDSNLALEGYAYSCLGVGGAGTINGVCSQYRILYQLEGQNEKCAGGLYVQAASAGNTTYCELIQCGAGKLLVRQTGGTSPWICQ